MSRFPSSVASPRDAAESRRLFTDRADFALEYSANQSLTLEKTEDFDENFMTVAFAKLHRATQGKSRSPDPGIDPQTKYDTPRRLEDVELVNHALKHTTTTRHIGTSMDFWQLLGLLGWRALLTRALGAGLLTLVVGWALGAGFDVWDVAIALAPIAGGAVFFVALALMVIRAADCAQSGDYDMTMMSLLRLVCGYGATAGANAKLDPGVEEHLVMDLLAPFTTGGAAQVHEITRVCGTKKLPVFGFGETENHILMIETARYLTNQLMAERAPNEPTYDNAANGLHGWMLDFLQQFLQNDFWEFNSRPYQRLSVLALQNLHDFARDPEVRKSARIALDYLSCKYAISSCGARRAAPFRRRTENLDVTDLFSAKSDEETWRFLILVGDPQVAGASAYERAVKRDFPSGGGVTMAHAAACRYRVPDLVVDFIFDPSPSLQRFRHGQSRLAYGDPAAEIYYHSERYLITGGGFFSDGRQGEDGMALPTTLMPAALGGDWGEFVRIDGFPPERRSNMGVAPGFACGVNPKIPASLSKPPIARMVNEHWTFLNCTKVAGLPPGTGFYVAVYRATESGTEFGFFAVTDESPDYPFDQWVGEVMQLNAATTFRMRQPNRFAFPSGRGPDVEFLPVTAGDLDWEIRAIAGRAQRTDLSLWPLVDGQVFAGGTSPTSDFVMRSWEHRGCVTFDNVRTDTRLILDLSDARAPRRAILKRSDPAGCDCPLQPRCDQDV